MTQSNMVADEFDLMDEVPESASGGFRNIGKLTMTRKFFAWRNGKTEEVSREDWIRLPAVVDNKNAKGIDYVFAVDIQEFKSSLQFSYERKVTVDSNDWKQIVAPSIEAIYGKGSMDKGDTKKGAPDRRSDTLRKMQNQYVNAEDVPQVPKRNAKPDAKVFNTIKFHKVYPTRETAHSEFVAMGGDAGAGTNGAGATQRDPMMPDSPEWTHDSWYIEAKKEIVEAVSKAINAAKTPPAKAKAKTEAIQKFASEYGSTVEQAEHLLNS